MPRLPPDAQARRAVAWAKKRNAAEQTDVTPKSVERMLRERFVAENPLASIADIEERVFRALERGMRPSPPAATPDGRAAAHGAPSGPEAAAQMKRRMLVSRKEAAEHLGVSLSWLETLHRAGAGPPYFKPTARVALYDLDEVERWLELTRVSPGSPGDIEGRARKAREPTHKEKTTMPEKQFLPPSIRRALGGEFCNSTPEEVAEADAFVAAQAVIGKPATKWATITPPLAIALLRRATRYPAFDERRAKRLKVEIMEHGRWEENGHAVWVATDGTLMDGRLRCVVVALTGIALHAPLTFGCNPADFANFDYGLGRDGPPEVG